METDKKKKLVNYTSTHSDLVEWVHDFSTHLKVDPYKNEIIYPENFGTGFAKVGCIESGLTYRVVDYRLNTDFIFSREPADQFYLILYFYLFTECPKLTLSINNDTIIDCKEENYSTLLMTNSFTSQKLQLSKGTCVKGLTIQLEEKWLKDKMVHSGNANYILFKQKKVFQAFIDSKSKKLLNELFRDNTHIAFPELYFNNRILRLLEGFLENILANGIARNTFPASAKDVHNILKIESILLEAYNSEFPSIEKLARLGLMSATRLKQSFKKAFGMGLYEYYQRNRMHKAKELLCTGKYSVSQVGIIIGYRNLSNFSKAFKKEFNYLPKDFNQIG
ncbi:MAG: helix-turn-helix transcriptional regulator [Bacteroidota bacterium]|nr:helix-turn-helix transcriptional regulator [Bacteroidota bacterium]